VPRWLLVLLAVSLAVLAIFAARPILFPPTNPHIAWENYNRITPGMSRGDVEAILGPPGDYRTGPIRYWVKPFRPTGNPFCQQVEWLSDEADIRVWFDHHGEVDCGWYEPVQPKEVGTAEKLRWRWDHWRESRR
jgi:hypothetical protein